MAADRGCAEAATPGFEMQPLRGKDSQVAATSAAMNHYGNEALPRLLIHVDLVAVQILERDSRAVRLNLGLAVELDARVLHPAILAQAVIGHDAEIGLRPTLLPHQGAVFV